MHQSLPLITTMATTLGLALVMGFIAIKLKLPTLVGYLLAGIILGPFTPGFVANTEIAAEFTEIGVMLLMFGVGLHFSLDNLLETRKIALPGALIQIVIATVLGACIALFWGWSLSNALVFGLALSVASTVVLIRALESQGLLGSINGQIAVGWLIVEDIAMILVLVFLPFLAAWNGGPGAYNHHSLWLILGITLFKISSFVIVMLLMGRWILPKILWHITRTGSRELFTLCVIATAVSIAFGASKLFGISLALGAFFAGMIIRESKFSRRAAEESLPFRDAFAVLFFVSVGMLFNPYIFIEKPLHVLAVVGIIVIGKSIAAAALVLAFRYPLSIALTVSASLAQIGEFSFILVGQGVYLKLLPVEGQELILAAALISIAINPFIFKLVNPLQSWMCSKFSWIQSLERSEDPLAEFPRTTEEKYLSGQVVLIGYGQVGKRVGAILNDHGIPYVVVEQNRELVEHLRKRKIAAIFGNTSEAPALIQAHITRASMLVIATSSIFNLRQMISRARELNPHIEIAVRAHNKEEAHLLQQEIDGTFFLSEEELAKGMIQHILARFGMSASTENHEIK
ncbi:cation:proton antiporter [Legionella maioricensis]|uniref:Cation:proton antiporter n=1 Tax=Legionella maioricensis TaxID=2896528 RepID=A0A9X2CY58_9GAMM|nr:cation:proton antiporter [Legionella maioricensis]MCL9683035.1 cation:proton antiporter [Legionella maioricensis]MCL9686383.1 cation:proton antiporter [Legionella maioricensis]